MHLSFAYKKAIQALNFFAVQAGGELNKMKVLKLIYFADRYHLRKYGRPITNDSYFALPYGPVASACRDLLNRDVADYSTPESDYKEICVQSKDQYNYESKEAVNQDVFSQTDMEALNYAWETYSRKNHFQLAEETHLFPEWKKHEAALGSEQVSRRAMPYSDFFENPEPGVDPMPELSVEDQQDLKEEIAELHAIESVWS